MNINKIVFLLLYNNFVSVDTLILSGNHFFQKRMEWEKGITRDIIIEYYIKKDLRTLKDYD